MIDKVQMHKDLYHLLIDLAQSLDDLEMDAERIRSIYARVIAEQMQDLQAVIDQERTPGAIVDPRQMTIWDLQSFPGQS